MLCAQNAYPCRRSTHTDDSALFMVSLWQLVALTPYPIMVSADVHQQLNDVYTCDQQAKLLPVLTLLFFFFFFDYLHECLIFLSFSLLFIFPASLSLSVSLSPPPSTCLNVSGHTWSTAHASCKDAWRKSTVFYNGESNFFE